MEDWKDVMVLGKFNTQPPHEIPPPPHKVLRIIVCLYARVFVRCMKSVVTSHLSHYLSGVITFLFSKSREQSKLKLLMVFLCLFVDVLKHKVLDRI